MAILAVESISLSFFTFIWSGSTFADLECSWLVGNSPGHSPGLHANVGLGVNDVARRNLAIGSEIEYNHFKACLCPTCQSDTRKWMFVSKEIGSYIVLYWFVWGYHVRGVRSWNCLLKRNCVHMVPCRKWFLFLPFYFYKRLQIMWSNFACDRS